MSYTKDEINPPCGCIFNINCTLHKSAPDMYEALKALLDEYQISEKGEGSLVWDKALDAVKKAEGR
jgi:hypothetical protein